MLYLVKDKESNKLWDWGRKHNELKFFQSLLDWVYFIGKISSNPHNNSLRLICYTWIRDEEIKDRIRKQSEWLYNKLSTDKR